METGAFALWMDRWMDRRTESSITYSNLFDGRIRIGWDITNTNCEACIQEEADDAMHHIAAVMMLTYCLYRPCQLGHASLTGEYRATLTAII